jgi:hypothetical protein
LSGDIDDFVFVAVVVNEARRDLISAHRKGGVHMYLSALEAWRAADSRHQ